MAPPQLRKKRKATTSCFEFLCCIRSKTGARADLTVRNSERPAVIEWLSNSIDRAFQSVHHHHQQQVQRRSGFAEEQIPMISISEDSDKESN